MVYRKKPVVIEAFKLGIDYIPDWFMDKITTNEIILHDSTDTNSGICNVDINTLEGVMHANYGDYIIKGINICFLFSISSPFQEKMVAKKMKKFYRQNKFFH